MRSFLADEMIRIDKITQIIQAELRCLRSQELTLLDESRRITFEQRYQCKQLLPDNIKIRRFGIV